MIVKLNQKAEGPHKSKTRKLNNGWNKFFPALTLLKLTHMTRENTYFPSKASGARSPNLLRNSKKGLRVGYPAQLILIASKTPYKDSQQ